MQWIPGQARNDVGFGAGRMLLRETTSWQAPCRRKNVNPTVLPPSRLPTRFERKPGVQRALRVWTTGVVAGVDARSSLDASVWLAIWPLRPWPASQSRLPHDTRTWCEYYTRGMAAGWTRALRTWLAGNHDGYAFLSRADRCSASQLCQLV